MFKGYIYRHWIVNDESVEKNYIGQVYNRTPEERWGINGSGYKPVKGKEPTHFYNAIQLYGWDNFNHKVLFSIECETLEELVFWLDEWEKYYIEKYDSFKNGYNSTLGGRGCLGITHTKETRKKISDTLKEYCGEKHHMYGKTGEETPMYGKHHSEETKCKMSKTKKGKSIKPHSEEHKLKIGNKVKGKQNGMAKSIICIETKQMFNTITDACQWCGTSNASFSIYFKGNSKSCGKHPITGEKLHWMYYDEYLEQQNKDNLDSKIA